MQEIALLVFGGKGKIQLRPDSLGRYVHKKQRSEAEKGKLPLKVQQ